MPTTTEITVRFRSEGFHRWPDAPTHRDYLATRHRHLFHINVTLPVDHPDRAIEFHDLLGAARYTFENYKGEGADFGAASCEMLAARLAGHLLSTFASAGYVRVEVSEDGECGATVTVSR